MPSEQGEKEKKARAQCMRENVWVSGSFTHVRIHAPGARAQQEKTAVGREPVQANGPGDG